MRNTFPLALLLTLCVFVCQVPAQDDILSRHNAMAPQIERELATAQKESDAHANSTLSQFRGSQPKDYTIEMLRNSSSAMKSLESKEYQGSPGFQSLSAKSRQFEQFSRLAESVQSTAASQNFSTGPLNTVFPHNGEVGFSATDISAPTRGNIGFTFIRSYRSHVNYSGAMGFGWDHNHNLHIVGDSTDIGAVAKLTLYNSNSETVFIKQGNIWEPEAGTFLHLEINSSNRHILISNSDKTVFDFEPTNGGWRIAKITSRKGSGKNALTYKYDSRSGQLQTVTDPFGNKFQFSYTNEGYLKWVQGAGQIVHYEYDRKGSLISVRIPSIALDLQNSTDFIESYKWLEIDSRRILEEISSNSNKTVVRYSYKNSKVLTAGIYSLSDNLQSKWQFNYSNNQTTVASPKPFPSQTYFYAPAQTNASAPVRREIPARKAVWKYRYNTDNLLIETVTPDGQVTKQKYDSNNPEFVLRGCILQESVIGNGSGNGFLIETGSRTKYVDNTAFPKEIVYYQIDRTGKETILGSESFTYSPEEFLLTQSISFTVPTRYYYNGYGEPALVQYADKSCKTFYYGLKYPSEYGNSINFTDGYPDAPGLCVRTISDANKQEVDNVARKIHIGKIETNSNTVNEVTQQAYSARGELLAQQTNNHIKYTYINRKGSVLLNYDTQTGLEINQFNEHFEKTATFHVLADTNAPWAKNISGFNNAFYQESFKYNSFGQLIEYQPTNEPLGQETQIPVWKYERTPSGLLLSITNPEGIRRVTNYNDIGQITEIYLENGQSRSVLSSEYTYSPEGRTLSFCDNNQQVIKTEYDEFGREYKTITPDGVETITEKNGLDQTVKELVVFDDQILSQADHEFGLNNKLVKRTQLVKYDDRSETITTQLNVFDLSGRIIASRGVRQDSWTMYFYDGLDRTVATVNPVGDMALTTYLNGNPVYQKLIEVNGLTDARVPFGVITLFDAADNAWLTVPVSTDGKLATQRRSISHSDIAGNTVYVINSDLTETRSFYNSVGQKTSQRVSPISHSFDEKDICSEYTFSISGLPKTTTTFNSALGIYGSKEQPSMEFIEAPQTIRYKYDDLGREIEVQQPDGLIVRKTYNSSSLIEIMQWYSNEDKELRSLRFVYDSLQRPVEIQDIKSGKTVRTLQYDKPGNLVRATDFSDGHEIVVSRKYDSVSSLRQEKITYDGYEFPVKEMQSQMESGIESLQWKGLNASDDSWWYKMDMISDKAGRVSQMRLNYSTQPFAQWKYQGRAIVERQIPESKITQTRYYNQYKELEKMSFKSASSSNPVQFELQYQYGIHGEITSSSASIHSSDKTKELTQYYQYDSFSNLTGQNSDHFIPSDFQKRHEEIFKRGTDVVSHLTMQMRFDQAGNLWNKFYGENSDAAKTTQFKPDNRQSYISPASIIANPKSVTPNELAQLASNRNTLIAESNGDAFNVKEYKYNDLGCLTEYDGKYTNEYGESTNVRWSLSYDVFGRLLSMEARKKSDKDAEVNNAIIARLNFAYDVFNRRLIKDVIDLSSKSERSRTYATLYDRNHPCLILQKIADNWYLEQQYLWGVESQETLMTAMSKRKAQDYNTGDIARYYTHQDAQFSVFATTTIVGAECTVTGTSSYLAFGENSSTVDVTDLRSSGTIANKTAAYDQKLDESANAQVSFDNSRTQFLEIQLEKHSNVEALMIYLDSFLDKFDVYSIPGEEKSPTADNIDSWLENADKSNTIKRLGSVLPDKYRFDHPCIINCGGVRCDRLVLVWKKENCVSQFQIRELQVNISSENSGSIAFAGQWLDIETGLYYQTNRYRLPELNGKFISPDPLGFADGINFYAYAHNNPLSWHDPDGQFPHIIAGGIIGGILGGGMYYLNCWWTGEEFSWARFGVATLSGAASGAVAAATCGTSLILSGAAAGATHGMINTTLNARLDGHSWGESLKYGAYSAVEEGVLGGIAGGIGGLISPHMSPGAPRLLEYVGNGVVSGGVTGALYGGYAGYRAEGWSGVLPGARRGFIRGAAIGGAVALGAYAYQSYIYSPSQPVTDTVTHSTEDIYTRPGLRKSVRDQIWENAKDDYGRVRDPGTGRYMSKNQPWDAGHKPGFEFYKHKQSAAERGIPRQQLIDEYNIAEHYRPERPSSNRSHRYEAGADINYWKNYNTSLAL